MLDQDQTPADDVLVDMTPVAPIPTLPPPPGSRRRLWLTLAACGVAAVIALAVAFAHDTADFGAYRYSPPKEFLGLPIVPAERIPKASPLPAGAKVSGYQTEDKSRSVVLTVRELPIISPSAVIDSVVTQATTRWHVEGLRTVEPGERGGVMKCGHITDMMKKAGKPQDVAFCVWVDGSMWAVYIEHGEDITLDTDVLANDARKFRHLAEVPS
ncbi:hypothetical protein ABZW30_20920 [Kitasatospora sp. NPDC004669]|uniref:hypothetical protein n=1 Tax=Kitasatospora sp. NPDC004669 TaxID=3154555 RepID=UPI0033BDA327